ncbi:S41 family peptidase [Croceitalea sp. MTPC5]|nr:S41 family peptidase [Croceitalea sp. MTPC5]
MTSPDMKKIILIFGYFALTTPLYTVAQDAKVDVFQKKYAPDSLNIQVKELMEGIGSGHPGMYRYTDKREFDFLIDSTFTTVTDSISPLTYYRLLKPLFAKIGCLHTSIELSEANQNTLNDSLKLIPIEVFIDDEKRAFVTKNYAKNETIPLKSEILAINGQSIAAILETLYNAIPSDGYNQTLKTLLLNYRFALWYRSMISTTNRFEIEARTKGLRKVYNLTGVSNDVFPTFETLERENENQLNLKITNDIGLLTVRSFAKSTIKKNDQNFDKFIKNTFKQLNQKQIEHVIIDLRNNTGGTDGNAVKLASYFFEQPFRYWAKIETTEDIAAQVKGFSRLFYKKPVLKDSSYHWRGSRWWLTKEFNYYRIQKPAKHNYKGNVYLITNGFCMSSCADVVAILSYNKKAEVIGTETGGGYQGNTSGLMPTSTINDDMQITIPLNKYTNAVDPNTNFGRGTIPDVRIRPTLDDWMNKKDVELEYIMKLIKDAKR